MEQKVISAEEIEALPYVVRVEIYDNISIFYLTEYIYNGYPDLKANDWANRLYKELILSNSIEDWMRENGMDSALGTSEENIRNVIINKFIEDSETKDSVIDFFVYSLYQVDVFVPGAEKYSNQITYTIDELEIYQNKEYFTNYLEKIIAFTIDEYYKRENFEVLIMLLTDDGKKFLPLLTFLEMYVGSNEIYVDITDYHVDADHYPATMYDLTDVEVSSITLDGKVVLFYGDVGHITYKIISKAKKYGLSIDIEVELQNITNSANKRHLYNYVHTMHDFDTHQYGNTTRLLNRIIDFDTYIIKTDHYPTSIGVPDKFPREINGKLVSEDEFYYSYEENMSVYSQSLFTLYVQQDDLLHLSTEKKFIIQIDGLFEKLNNVEGNWRFFQNLDYLRSDEEKLSRPLCKKILKMVHSEDEKGELKNWGEVYLLQVDRIKQLVVIGQETENIINSTRWLKEAKKELLLLPK